MDIRITRQAVCYCTICNDVREIKEKWDKEQNDLVADGKQEEAIPFPGVPGYRVKDADDFKYGYNEICDKCMSAIMKGVKIITDQKLTGISLKSE